jgi:hypothetical protein
MQRAVQQQVDEASRRAAAASYPTLEEIKAYVYVG